MKMGHPQEKILMQSNTDPKTTLSLLYRRGADGAPFALRLLFTKGRDGSYLLWKWMPAKPLTKRGSKRSFLKKYLMGLK